MIKIKNWSTFQSYKDRNPPWIRFHKKILDNYEYQSMSSDSRALLPMLWLLASEDADAVSGLIRIGYEQIAFRLRLDIDVVANCVAECEGKGFLVEIKDTSKNPKHQDSRQCIESVTEPLRISNQSVTPETETETEKACVRSRSRRGNSYPPEFKAFWKFYPRHVAKKVALKAWEKAVQENPPEDLISAAKEYANQCERDRTEERFIKHPATFLNQDRWKDYCFEEVKP